jgi:DNA processing protein
MENVIGTLEKNDLPFLLRQIPDPPKKLFIRGPFPDQNQKFLCVVGSRKNTRYGKDACSSLISGLRGYNIVIVSGLALGIDALAHEAALSAGLTTVAVPGSGLSWDKLYPRANRTLAKRILSAGGALVSEFENDFRAIAYGFPRRNRIMAGMSHAVLVVESELQSGTLITSRLATEYNRDVFTVPGSIFSKKSEGPNMLLRLGALSVSKSEDILMALGFMSPEEAKNAGKESQSKKQRTYEKCSQEEQRLISLLQENPMNRVELIARSDMSAGDAIIAISLLELKGLIIESGGEIRLK